MSFVFTMMVIICATGVLVTIIYDSIDSYRELEWENEVLRDKLKRTRTYISRMEYERYGEINE